MLMQNDIVPLYQQLKDILKNSIVSRELLPGDKIASEIELSEKYEVSRVTVRNAISDLVKEGLLVKKQGKGTFVSKPVMERSISEFLSFTLACKVNGMRPGSVTISKTLIDAEQEDIDYLKLDENDKILSIKRVRHANDEPIILEYNYFSYKDYSFLLSEDLTNNSLYKILEEKYNVILVRSTSTIEIHLAAEDEVEYLNVPLGTPLFLLRSVIYDDKDNPVHRCDQYVIGDRFKIVYNNSIKLV